MFNIKKYSCKPHEIHIQTIGGSGDEHFLEDLKNNVLSDCHNIEYVDNSGMVTNASFPGNPDLSILLILSDESDDHQQLIDCIEHASANSLFTVAFVPIGKPTDCKHSNSAASNNSNNDEKLQWLKKIQAVVDTLVLLKEDRRTVDTAIVGAVPQLLSGATFIGIDYADIRYVLTCEGAEVANGVFIAGSEELTDPDNPEFDAKRLGAQLLQIAGTPLEYCLGSFEYGREFKLSLDTATKVQEELYGTLCKYDSTVVYSVVLRSRDALHSIRSRLVCIAGELDLTSENLNRIIHRERSS